MNGAIDTIYGYPSQMRVSRNSNEIGLPKNLGRGSCVKTVHKSLKRVVSNFKEDQNQEVFGERILMRNTTSNFHWLHWFFILSCIERIRIQWTSLGHVTVLYFYLNIQKILFYKTHFQKPLTLSRQRLQKTTKGFLRGPGEENLKNFLNTFVL